MNIMNNDPDMNQHWIATLTSSTSFQVTSLLLEDIKLLNSEIGRLAMSSSLISSCSSWTFQMAKSFLFQASAFQYTRNTYLRSEYLGYKACRGDDTGAGDATRTTTGIRVVGETGDINIDRVVACVYSGCSSGCGCVYYQYGSIWSDKGTGNGKFLGKLVASIVPLLIYKSPYKDSFTLGLILSSQVLFDIIFYKLFLRFTHRHLLNHNDHDSAECSHCYSSDLPSLDPSKRYMNYKRRTIQQSIHESELRIILCVHEEDQVFSLMNLLNASNPTREQPIGAFVLDLMELVGRDHPMLINHQFHKPD
ncbi:Cation/H(+) antiporter 3 [Camellia lanceoleosa]|nr:Cation/H(+) antiporter 3 [Camellia lanceoleosa]